MGEKKFEIRFDKLGNILIDDVELQYRLKYLLEMNGELTLRLKNVPPRFQIVLPRLQFCPPEPWPKPIPTPEPVPPNPVPADPIPYAPGGLLEAGFTAAVPEYDAIKAGLPTLALPDTAPALVLWAYLYGSRTGDEVAFRISGPQGVVLEEAVMLDKPQAQLFRAMGKRLTGAAWPVGDYAGTVTLRRGGAVLDQINVTVQITR